MSIEREGREFYVNCDFCSNDICDYNSFQEAVEGKKVNGWKNVNIKGEWFDKCPVCQKGES